MGSARWGWTTMTRDDVDKVVVRWSRPWLLEQTSGIVVDEVFFAPVRLGRSVRLLRAHGWRVYEGPTSRLRHRIGLVVQLALMVGFVALAALLLS